MTPSATVDVYDGSTGLWSQSVLSVARHYMGVTVVGTKAFFAGGGAASCCVCCDSVCVCVCVSSGAQ